MGMTKDLLARVEKLEAEVAELRKGTTSTPAKPAAVVSKSAPKAKAD